MSPWKDTLVKLGQTRAFFSTSNEFPYSSKFLHDLLPCHTLINWETPHFMRNMTDILQSSALCQKPATGWTSSHGTSICAGESSSSDYTVGKTSWKPEWTSKSYTRLHGRPTWGSQTQFLKNLSSSVDPCLWGLLFIPFHLSNRYRFEQYTSTRLLAQFDEDLYPIQKISLRISTGNVIGPRYKLRLLRIRITPLNQPERFLFFSFSETTPISHDLNVSLCILCVNTSIT